MRSVAIAAVAALVVAGAASCRCGGDASSAAARDAGAAPVLPAGIEIAGVVVDGGAGVPGAKVTIDGEGGARIELAADAEGGFRVPGLPAGVYRIWAHDGDLASSTVRLQRLAPGPYAPVTLVVDRAAIVVGRVVDRATGIGIEALVSLETEAGDPPRYGRSRSDGAFRIEGVPRGRWLLDAVAPGWVSTGAVEIEAGRGIPTLELAPGAIVEGRVVDGAGAPVAGATVRAERPARAGLAGRDFTDDPDFIPRGELGVLRGPLPFPPPPGAARAARAPAATPAPVASPALPPDLPVDPAYVPTLVTDRDGRFRITGLAAGAWIVHAAAPAGQGQSGELALDLGRVAGGVEIAIVRADAIVRGRVVDPDGLPVRGAEVTVEGRGARGRTDDTGWFEVTGLPAGDATITVAHPDFPAARLAVTTGADAAVTLPWGGVIEGVLLDHHTGEALIGAPVVAGEARARTGARGAFALGPVPAGTHTVKVTLDGYLPVERAVEVAPRGRVRDLRLELARGALLAGVVRDRYGSRLPGATVVVAAAGGAKVRARTDDGGEFRLRDVPTGDVVVEASAGGLRAEKALTLRPGDEMLTFQIELE